MLPNKVLTPQLLFKRPNELEYNAPKIASSSFSCVAMGACLFKGFLLKPSLLFRWCLLIFLGLGGLNGCWALLKVGK